MRNNSSDTTLDSNVCKNKFITPTPANNAPSIGCTQINNPNKDNMIIKNTIPPRYQPSINCCIYQLSGI
jgi:hypothetical protein